MISVAVSIIGVPVIPTKFWMSPQEVSDAANGASRVLEVMVAPVSPSRTRTIFKFETIITYSLGAPGGVYCIELSDIFAHRCVEEDDKLPINNKTQSSRRETRNRLITTSGFA